MSVYNPTFTITPGGGLLNVIFFYYGSTTTVAPSLTSAGGQLVACITGTQNLPSPSGSTQTVIDNIYVGIPAAQPGILSYSCKILNLTPGKTYEVYYQDSNMDHVYDHQTAIPFPVPNPPVIDINSLDFSTNSIIVNYELDSSTNYLPASLHWIVTEYENTGAVTYLATQRYTQQLDTLSQPIGTFPIPNCIINNIYKIFCYLEDSNDIDSAYCVHGIMVEFTRNPDVPINVSATNHVSLIENSGRVNDGSMLDFKFTINDYQNLVLTGEAPTAYTYTAYSDTECTLVARSGTSPITTVDLYGNVACTITTATQSGYYYKFACINSYGTSYYSNIVQAFPLEITSLAEFKSFNVDIRTQIFTVDIVPATTTVGTMKTLISIRILETEIASYDVTGQTMPYTIAEFTGILVYEQEYTAVIVSTIIITTNELPLTITSPEDVSTTTIKHSPPDSPTNLSITNHISPVENNNAITSRAGDGVLLDFSFTFNASLTGNYAVTSFSYMAFTDAACTMPVSPIQQIIQLASVIVTSSGNVTGTLTTDVQSSYYYKFASINSYGISYYTDPFQAYPLIIAPIALINSFNVDIINQIFTVDIVPATTTVGTMKTLISIRISETEIASYDVTEQTMPCTIADLTGILVYEQEYTAVIVSTIIITTNELPLTITSPEDVSTTTIKHTPPNPPTNLSITNHVSPVENNNAITSRAGDGVLLDFSFTFNASLTGNYAVTSFSYMAFTDAACTMPVSPIPQIIQLASVIVTSSGNVTGTLTTDVNSSYYYKFACINLYDDISIYTAPFQAYPLIIAPIALINSFKVNVIKQQIIISVSPTHTTVGTMNTQIFITYNDGVVIVSQDLSGATLDMFGNVIMTSDIELQYDVNYSAVILSQISIIPDNNLKITNTSEIEVTTFTPAPPSADVDFVCYPTTANSLYCTWVPIADEPTFAYQIGLYVNQITAFADVSSNVISSNFYSPVINSSNNHFVFTSDYLSFDLSPTATYYFTINVIDADTITNTVAYGGSGQTVSTLITPITSMTITKTQPILNSLGGLVVPVTITWTDPSSNNSSLSNYPVIDNYTVYLQGTDSDTMITPQGGIAYDPNRSTYSFVYNADYTKQTCLFKVNKSGYNNGPIVDGTLIYSANDDYNDISSTTSGSINITLKPVISNVIVAMASNGTDTIVSCNISSDDPLIDVTIFCPSATNFDISPVALLPTTEYPYVSSLLVYNVSHTYTGYVTNLNNPYLIITGNLVGFTIAENGLC